jgi:hypothetical protein
MARAPSVSGDDISTLIREKQVYDTIAPVATPEVIIPTRTLTVSSSEMLQEHEMYIAGRSSTDIVTPGLTPGFVVDPSMQQFFSTESAMDGFFATYQSPSISEKKDTMGRVHKERKVGTTHGTIRTSIQPGTIITTSTGLILNEDTLDIASIPYSEKAKAKK